MTERVENRGSRVGYKGRRLTASSNPKARDWKITFHRPREPKKLSEAEKARQNRQSILVLGKPREEAERQMWLAEHVKGNRAAGLKCKLWIFTPEYGWCEAPPMPKQAKPVEGIVSLELVDEAS